MTPLPGPMSADTPMGWEQLDEIARTLADWRRMGHRHAGETELLEIAEDLLADVNRQETT